MSVSAAATMPPVQDSAVASLSPALRQDSSTATASSARALMAKDQPPDQHDEREHAAGIERGEDVVEHDAEPAADLLVGPARRPRLGDVGDAEEDEAERVAEGVERRRGEHQPLRRDLVDDDGAGVLDAAGAPDDAGHPPAEREGERRRDRQPLIAPARLDRPG